MIRYLCATNCLHEKGTMTCLSRNLCSENSNNSFGAPCLWLSFVKCNIFGLQFEMAMTLTSDKYISNAASKKSLTMEDGTSLKTIKQVMEMIFEILSRKCQVGRNM